MSPVRGSLKTSMTRTTIWGVETLTSHQESLLLRVNLVFDFCKKRVRVYTHRQYFRQIDLPNVYRLTVISQPKILKLPFESLIGVEVLHFVESNLMSSGICLKNFFLNLDYKPCIFYIYRECIRLVFCII